MATPVVEPARPVELEWGIKRSFIEYVRSLADGGIATSGAASLGDDDVALFPFDPASSSWNDDGTARILAFTGTVTASAHGGWMVVELFDPWIEHDENGWRLTNGSADGEPRTTIAELAPIVGSGDSRFEATLTRGGTFWLGGKYRLGDAVDPVGYRV